MKEQFMSLLNVIFIVSVFVTILSFAATGISYIWQLSFTLLFLQICSTAIIVCVVTAIIYSIIKGM